MSAIPVVAVLALSCTFSSVPATATADYPGDFTAPTGQQLEHSVQTWNPHGSVHTWSIADSVTPLVVEKQDASSTVLTLTSDVLFAFGKADITAAAAAAITTELAAISQGVAVSVGGYTDSIGDAADNQVLSERRANAVADVITSARPDLVLTVEGFGENNPVADNMRGGADYPQGRQQNRRVEIRYAR